MRLPVSLPALLISALALAACTPANAPESTAASTVADTPASPAPAAAPAPGPAAGPAANPAPPAAPEPPAKQDFDPTSVPETSATLPPFPFFKIPPGLESTYADKDKLVNFDRQYFIAADAVVAVEGKIFHDRFPLNGGSRSYTDIEFRRNYENAITALGGRKINTSQYTPEIMAPAGGRDALEKHNYAASLVPDYPHDIYLLRQGGKEWWVDVSTGAIPLHGYVVVLEREGMQQSLELLDAAAMKKAIDADGHVALHVNFDTDKATLRPDAQPTIAEIGKLLDNDPGLKLSIEGHTDNTGTPAHNQALSAARARSVLGALVGLGIDPARLSSKGHGQAQPIADNATPAGRAQNRRVELVKVM